MKEDLCHCGKPLHYQSEFREQTVRRIVAEQGEYVVVAGFGGRSWKVQRHYMALHGPKAAQLPFLGFEEVTAKGAGA